MYALKSFFSIRCKKTILFSLVLHMVSLSPRFGVCFPLACGRQMNGNWRVWEPDVKTLLLVQISGSLGPGLHWLDMQTVLKGHHKYWQDSTTTPFQLTLPGGHTWAVWVGEGAVVTEWDYGGLPWLRLIDSTVHPTLGLENNFRVGGSCKNWRN